MYIFVDEDGNTTQSDTPVPEWEEKINSGEFFSTLLYIPPSGDLAKVYSPDSGYYVIPQRA